jgi:protein-S-isoprenylcysteine O-methyltransferase Ste14
LDADGPIITAMRGQAHASGRRTGGPGRGWFLAGYAGVAGFLVLETMRRPGPASAMHRAPDDAGSTRDVALAFGAVALSAPVLRRIPVRRLPWPVAALGLAMQATGLALRAWSMQTLRQSYTRTLRVSNEQEVVDRGPYRHLRHPGYLGSLLVWAGFGLSSCSVPVVGAVAALIVPAYVRRIDTEEILLEGQLHGYAAYRAKTRKLLPAIW